MLFDACIQYITEMIKMSCCIKKIDICMDNALINGLIIIYRHIKRNEVSHISCISSIGPVKYEVY